jgi:diguanylate cyclase (GGDEF)-like protein/PAS domain S-box-containing protein
VILNGWSTVENRAAVIAEDYSETTNLVRSLAQHAHDTMKFADIMLVAMRDNLEGGGWDRKQIALLQREALADVANMPSVHGVLIFDATGKWVVNSLSRPSASLVATNETYFKYHQTHADRDIRIGDLLPCRIVTDCTFVIPVSRRIDAPDGSFAGVAVATVAVDYLKEFYGTFAVGRQGLVALVQTNGRVVVRAASNEVAPGTDASSGDVFRRLLPRSPIGVYKEASPIDGILRLGSYRKVDEFPLVVMVAHAENEVLAVWRRDALLHLGITVSVAAAIGILGLRLAHHIKSGQQAEHRYRVLADNSSDAIVCVGFNGKRMYASPAFATLTGRSLADSVGARIGDDVHPDDRQKVVDDLQMLRDHRAREVTHQYRYLRDDGSVLWIEARARFVEAYKGLPAQIIANLRDITERKAAEERIVALNLELEKQALTDGLTGLFNRRRFDEALGQEWSRAARAHQPLSLVMVDVDRFKLYNDHYGHQQGDDALRLVASALSKCCRRPGDLAARYGGEEMVLLLPGANEEGAMGRAEAARAAIQGLGLPHAGNPALPVLTASVGVATLLPSLDEVAGAPQALIAAADAALYEAKRTGRNRVICAAPPNWDVTRLIETAAEPGS